MLAREVGYSGVGTVEFLVKDEDFFFLEMNPRLQVEHGITEEITRTDLVELQIRIARGEKLDGLWSRDHGVCIEARVCAEDPDQGFLPAPGRIALFDPALGPAVAHRHRRRRRQHRAGGVRLDGRQGHGVRRHARRSARAPGQRAARLRSRDRARRDQQELLDPAARAEPYRARRRRHALARSLERRARQAAAARRRGLGARRHPRRTARSGAPSVATSSPTPARITPDKIPALDGRELDLEYRGESYRAARVLGRLVALPRAPRRTRGQRALRRSGAAHRAHRDRGPLPARRARRHRRLHPRRGRGLRAPLRSPDRGPSACGRAVDGRVDRREAGRRSRRGRTSAWSRR